MHMCVNFVTLPNAVMIRSDKKTQSKNHLSFSKKVVDFYTIRTDIYIAIDQWSAANHAQTKTLILHLISIIIYAIPVRHFCLTRNFL
jgi:D-alanyl-D-alanine dipeptidase